MNTATITLRKLEPTDNGVYRALMLRAYSEHENAYTSTFEERATKSLDWWANRLSDPTSVTYAAFAAGDVPVGLVRVERYQRSRERHKIQMTSLYVIRDQAQQGVGRLLVQQALEAARGFKGVELMHLVVNDDNMAALRLFARAGFQNYGREPRGIKLANGSAYLDRLYFWRPVSADYIAPL